MRPREALTAMVEAKRALFAHVGIDGDYHEIDAHVDSFWRIEGPEVRWSDGDLEDDRVSYSADILGEVHRGPELILILVHHCTGGEGWLAFSPDMERPS